MDNFFNEEFENEIQKMGLDGYLNNEFIMNENIPNTIETLDMKFNENIVSEVSNQKSKAVANTVSDMISNISETKPIEIVICDIDNQSQMTKNLNLLLKQSTLVRNLSLSSVVNDENVAIIISNYMMYYYYHLIKTHGIDYVMYLHYVSSCIDSGIEYIPTHFALPHLRDNDIHQFVVATYRKTEPHKFWGYFCSDTLTPLSKGIFEKALISSYSACQATMLMLNKTIERQHRKRNFEQQINNNGTSMLLDNSYEPIVTYASCSIPGHGSCTTIAGNGCYLNNACISTSLLLKELMNGNYKCENGNYQPHILILDLDATQGNGCYQIMNHWKETGYINDNVKYVSFQSDEVVEPYFLSYQTSQTTNLKENDNEYFQCSFSGDNKYLPINLGLNTSASHNINVPRHYIGNSNFETNYYQNYIRYLTLFCHEAKSNFSPDFIIILLGTNLMSDNSNSFTKNEYMTIGGIIGDIFIATPTTVIQETLTGDDENGVENDSDGDKVLYFLRGLRCDASDN